MRYFSMFSGIGGFELGIQRTTNNMETEQSREKRGDKDKKERNSSNITISSRGRWEESSICIGFSEIDKYAIQTYQKHFNHKAYGDAKDIRWQEVQDFELLVAGFPCQSFSIAGKREGFEDTRGTLFFEIARCLKDKRPPLCFLENVKGLLSHDEGKTFSTILTTLSELGYDAEWQCLNSKHFGVPQNRERVFIIGHFRGTGGEKVFPIQETTNGSIQIHSRGKHQQDIVYGVDGIMANLPAGTYASTPHLTKIADFRYDEGLRPRKDGLSPCLFDQAKGGGLSNELFVIQPLKVWDNFNKCWRADNIAGALKGEGISIPSSATILNGIRRLTPIECERLQGFPDGWTEGVSDTQRYKQLGNAVTVNVIEAIAKNLLNLTKVRK